MIRERVRKRRDKRELERREIREGVKEKRD